MEVEALYQLSCNQHVGHSRAGNQPSCFIKLHQHQELNIVLRFDAI